MVIRMSGISGGDNDNDGKKLNIPNLLGALAEWLTECLGG